MERILRASLELPYILIYQNAYQSFNKGIIGPIGTAKVGATERLKSPVWETAGRTAARAMRETRIRDRRMGGLHGKDVSMMQDWE